MSRLKIGKTYGSFARKLANGATAPTTALATATPSIGGKLDPEIDFVAVDEGADPLTVTLRIPAYDTTYHTLEALTAIAVPLGSGKPHSAEGWMASSFPKVTLALAPATVQAAPTVADSAPTVAPVAAPMAMGAPAIASVAATTTNPAVSPTTSTAVLEAPPAVPPVSAPTVAISASLPGPSGGNVTLGIPGVGNGYHEIVMIEQYDQ